MLEGAVLFSPLPPLLPPPLFLLLLFFLPLQPAKANSITTASANAAILALFVFAFAEGINKNSRSYARAALIGLLTAALLFAAAAVLCYLYTDEIIGWVRSLVEKLMSMAA